MNAKYLTPNAPSFNVRLTLEDGSSFKVQFKNGIFETDDDAVITSMDKSLATGSSLGLHVKKVNLEDAERIVAEHMAKLGHTPDAIKGGMHSGHLDMLREGADPLASKQTENEMSPNNPEQMAELEENLGEDVVIGVEKVEIDAPLETENTSQLSKAPLKL